jgi:hypothetical protein
MGAENRYGVSIELMHLLIELMHLLPRRFPAPPPAGRLFRFGAAAVRLPV